MDDNRSQVADDNASVSPIIPRRVRHQPRPNDSSSGDDEEVNPRRKNNNILVDDGSSSSNYEEQISSNNIKKRKRQLKITRKADDTLEQLRQHERNKGKPRLKSATKPTKRGKLSNLPKRRM